MRTFTVSDVARGKLYDGLDIKTSVTSLLDRPVEGMACTASRLVSCETEHAFVKAAHDAFYDHHPMVIRPDDIWFCIAQGFAAHVRERAEELRHLFVAHEGKMTLRVFRPDFILGQENPWPEVFTAFSTQIGEQVGRAKDLLSASFSTTTMTETAAYDVCLMDGFQGYFDYVVSVGCGIPEFTVLGTPEDWRSMLPRLKEFKDYGLEPWAEILKPVITKIAETVEGDVDTDFWRSFFRYQSGSGPAELTGWIVTLFPYIKVDWTSGGLGPNQYLPGWRRHFQTAESRPNRWIDFNHIQGPGINALPSSLASAPVLCENLRTGEKVELRFVAGMFGVNQDADTGALSPAFGWAVVHDVPGAEASRAHERHRELFYNEEDLN